MRRSSSAVVESSTRSPAAASAGGRAGRDPVARTAKSNASVSVAPSGRSTRTVCGSTSAARPWT